MNFGLNMMHAMAGLGLLAIPLGFAMTIGGGWLALGSGSVQAARPAISWAGGITLAVAGVGLLLLSMLAA